MYIFQRRTRKRKQGGGREEEERRRTIRTTTTSRESVTIKNIKDGRNKPAISVIKETINGLTSIIKKTVNLDFLILKSNYRDFPGSPMVAKTPRSQCREPGFDPWSGN